VFFGIQVQASIADMARFSRLVKFKAFQPFKSAEEALNNINSISEGLSTPHFLFCVTSLDVDFFLKVC
jgi:hypothetical protein